MFTLLKMFVITSCVAKLPTDKNAFDTAFLIFSIEKASLFPSLLIINTYIVHFYLAKLILGGKGTCFFLFFTKKVIHKICTAQYGTLKN